MYCAGLPFPPEGPYLCSDCGGEPEQPMVEGEFDCCICMDPKPLGFKVKPTSNSNCVHPDMPMCSDCVFKHVEHASECPFCRQPVGSLLHVASGRTFPINSVRREPEMEEEEEMEEEMEEEEAEEEEAEEEASDDVPEAADLNDDDESEDGQPRRRPDRPRHRRRTIDDAVEDAADNAAVDGADNAAVDGDDDAAVDGADDDADDAMPDNDKLYEKIRDAPSKVFLTVCDGGGFDGQTGYAVDQFEQDGAKYVNIEFRCEDGVCRRAEVAHNAVRAVRPDAIGDAFIKINSNDSGVLLSILQKDEDKKLYVVRCRVWNEEMHGYEDKYDAVESIDGCIKILPIDEPESDLDAMELLHKIAGNRWKSVKGDKSRTVWTYETTSGLWSKEREAFLALLKEYRHELGPYAQRLHLAERVLVRSGMENVVNAEWTQRLNLLEPGMVPFNNGMFELATKQLHPYTPEMMCSVKFDIDAPGADENVDTEKQWLMDVINKLFPELELKIELMKRIAYAFFEGKPWVEKMVVQMFGDGNK